MPGVFPAARRERLLQAFQMAEPILRDVQVAADVQEQPLFLRSEPSVRVSGLDLDLEEYLPQSGAATLAPEPFQHVEEILNAR